MRLTGLIAGMSLLVSLALPGAGLAASPGPAAAPPLNPERLEWGGTPVLSGDSDIGVGFGALFRWPASPRAASPSAGASRS